MLTLQLKSFSKDHLIKLGSEYGVNKGKTHYIKLGINRIKLNAVGRIRYQYSDNRPMCYGSPFTDASGEDHPNAIVLTNYKITYRRKKSYTIGTQIVTELDDGSCHILPHQDVTTCYSEYSGINYIITRLKKIPQSCDYLPTRKSLIIGEILSQNNVDKVFISHEQKILLKLTKETDICQCKKMGDKL